MITAYAIILEIVMWDKILSIHVEEVVCFIRTGLNFFFISTFSSHTSTIGCINLLWRKYYEFS